VSRAFRQTESERHRVVCGQYSHEHNECEQDVPLDVADPRGVGDGVLHVHSQNPVGISDDDFGAKHGTRGREQENETEADGHLGAEAKLRHLMGISVISRPVADTPSDTSSKSSSATVCRGEELAGSASLREPGDDAPTRQFKCSCHPVH